LGDGISPQINTDKTPMSNCDAMICVDLCSSVA
jgi:hypothetical protein